MLLIFLNFGTSIKLFNMGGKHRKSRYDSSSLSATDTSDSSSSDSEVSFVVNHSHRHKSQHRINKLKHKKNKKHKKDRRYRSSSSDSSESCECKHKKHKHHGSKHHKEQKHHTNSSPCRINNKERHSNNNFDDWYCQDRIAYHSKRDKFEDGYHYRDQDNYDRAPKADSHDRYYRDRYAIDRHYDRDKDRDGYYERDNHDRGKYFANHSHDEMVCYHSEHQINSKYERKIRHVPTQQHFQPQHFVDCPGYAAYYTNTQHTEPTLSVPSQHPDLIKHIDSNQQMINYHVPINPVYVGPYHQFASMSSAPEDIGNTPMVSFQEVSYQADVSGSLGLPTQGIDVHTDYSSHAVQSQAHGSRSSCFSSPMTHVNYPSQTDGTMITTSSTNAVCCITPLSQEQVLMDYFDSHISSSPVHASVSTTAASFIYTNDHLQFNSQSTSVQSAFHFCSVWKSAFS